MLLSQIATLHLLSLLFLHALRGCVFLFVSVSALLLGGAPGFGSPPSCGGGCRLGFGALVGQNFLISPLALYFSRAFGTSCGRGFWPQGAALCCPQRRPHHATIQGPIAPDRLRTPFPGKYPSRPPVALIPPPVWAPLPRWSGPIAWLCASVIVAPWAQHFAERHRAINGAMGKRCGCHTHPTCAHTFLV